MAVFTLLPVQAELGNLLRLFPRRQYNTVNMRKASFFCAYGVVVFGCLAGVCRAIDVCVVGYVMDTFCIERGTLLDNPALKTLERPDAHSVHCL